MTELTDERLAELRAQYDRWTLGGPHPDLAVVDIANNVPCLLAEITRLRAENAALVAARTELVEGLRVFGPPCDTEDWPDDVELTYEQGTQAERLVCTLGEMRRAAELVARHSP